MRVSVIVPTYRDDAALAVLLPALASLDPAPDEIVVVDGASAAATAAICRGAGATWLASEPGRGRQLRNGAARAAGDVLWFVHADAGVPAGAIAAIRRSVEAGAVGGYFRFRFAPPRRAIQSPLEACIAWRCRLGMVYGDQGLFATRAAYEASPGFAPEPLFEEVPLVRALRRTGRFRALDETIEVSPRRWERDGYLRRTLSNRLLALGHALGVSPTRLARWYVGRRKEAR